MATNNIIIPYKSGNKELMSPGQVITLGEGTAFDTVTERYYFGNGIPAEYDAGGSKNPEGISGGSWVCIGPSDVERLPGGPVIATITWRGLKNSAGGISTTETRAIRETTYASISGIPGTTGSVQGRLLDQTVGFSLRAITTTPNSFKQTQITANNTTIPGINTALPNVTRSIAVVNAAKVYTYPNGWLCYSWQAEEPLKGIFLVSAEYRYEPASVFT